MADLRPKDLFGKLNQLGYRTLDGAANFCRMRTNPSVELVHWLHQMLNEPESDLQAVVRHFGIDDSRLVSDLTAALSHLPRGAGSITGFGLSLREAIEQGWIYASLMFKQHSIRGGHLLVGCLKNPSLEVVLRGLSSEFRKLNGDELINGFDDILKSSIENSSAEAAPASGEEAPVSGGPPVPGRVEALARFTTDLVAEAKAGEIDPITGRDKEIRQITDILLRRRQNNPILTGEAGVGKTAVVEGLALKVAAGDVPPALRGVELRTLDLGALKAGASMRGEFEKRLKQVIEEVEGSPVPIILFIDEAHTLIGAGGQEGQGDAANLLKPALARGKLRTIAATTWKEYKMYFEKDNALERRFQPVVIDEPDVDAAWRIAQARRAPRGADLGGRDGGGSEVLQALHPRASIARQGRQPDGHRRVASLTQPACHTRGSGRLPQAHRSLGYRAGDSQGRGGCGCRSIRRAVRGGRTDCRGPRASREA
jgi:type VI secretion system protein VasG